MPRPTLLFTAITPQETATFFPADLLPSAHNIAAQVHVFDPASHDEAAFLASLTAADPEILLTGWATPPLPAALPPRLRYVCHLTGSVRHVVTREHLAAGLLVTNWGDAISRTVAEAALLHLLAALRRTTATTLDLHVARAWQSPDATPRSLFGRRVGLHGFGAVARELVKLLAPFGVTISVHAPDVDTARAATLGLTAAPDLPTLFRTNDAVVCLAPLNTATQGSITADLLNLLPPGGVFINVGRGAVVDEAGLARVAHARPDLAFGLDVFATEPLPADSPLRGLRNLHLTPHLAGPTLDRRRDAGEFALRNLQAYAAGHPLTAVITPERYDTAT